MFFEMNLGGASIDLYNPDVVWQGDLTSTGTHSISVTKKPRFIVWGSLRSTGTSDGSHLGGMMLVDCDKQKLRMIWFGASGYTDQEESTGQSFADRIVALTSSIVTVKGNGAYTTRNHVAIYY